MVGAAKNPKILAGRKILPGGVERRFGAWLPTPTPGAGEGNQNQEKDAESKIFNST